MAERIRTRFLVVGSGVAGLHTAWRASADGDVMVLTKRSLFDSATAYAQGGIAAALGAGDSPELHRQDTLAAGAALADAKAVQVLVEEGPARVRELATAGAQFDLEPGGNFKLGREAAHSRRRIVHAHGDQTGAEVARTLIKRVKETASIQVLEKARILELIAEDGMVFGVRAAVSGKAVEIIADATVLATGGCGQVYRYTTNPQVATGDGYAIAHRAGARLADMEFVQFHPTALAGSSLLLSEALRGDGALLVKNPDYYLKDRDGRQLPYVDAVRLYFTKDAATETALFRSKQLDVMRVSTLDQLFALVGVGGQSGLHYGATGDAQPRMRLDEVEVVDVVPVAIPVRARLDACAELEREVQTSLAHTVHRSQPDLHHGLRDRPGVLIVSAVNYFDFQFIARCCCC